MMRTEIITDEGCFSWLAGEWDDLLRRSGCNSPTLSSLWLDAWWRTFGGEGGRELRLLLFRDGDRLVGAAPLLRRLLWHRRAIPRWRLELVASGEDEADEICSDYLGVVAESGAEQVVARALADELRSGALGAWDELVLPVMSGEADIVPLLCDALRDLGALCCEVAGGCPYIVLPGSWDDYLRQLSSSRRYLIRRSLRAFEQWAKGPLELRTASSPEELRRGTEILHTLHGERWKAAGRQGVFVSPRFRQFHDLVMQRLYEMGALDLLWLEVGADPVTVVYNIVWNNKVYFYQSGRRTGLPSGLRPGLVLHALAIQRAIERGLREYDFLGGASDYKMQLATEVRPLRTIRVMRRSLAGKLHRVAEGMIGAGRYLRQLIRDRETGTARPADPD